MRLILSRKGFDSGYGRVASPILPDGRMVSLPIPAVRSAKRYGEISFAGHPLSNLTEQLTDRHVRSGHLAHLDPDLDPNALPRQPGWRPVFGQEKAAQRHLQNEGVSAKSVFLYFGWMRQTEIRDDRLCYVKGAPDIHCLFGWLQVDRIIQVDDRLEETRQAHPWLVDHPHVNAHAAPGNTIYAATKRLVIGGRDLGVPGGGVFPRFHDGLRLTAPGATRSVWHLPDWFCLDELAPRLSYHRDPNRWVRDGEHWRMQAVAKGQEFVLKVDDEQVLADWMSALLSGG